MPVAVRSGLDLVIDRNLPLAGAVDLLRSELRPGDVVLVKASRSVGLESIAEALLDAEGEVAAR